MKLGSNSVLHSINKLFFRSYLHDFRFLGKKEKPSITVRECHISKYNKNHVELLSCESRNDSKDWGNYMFIIIKFQIFIC